MSMMTALLGLDKLISATRNRDYFTMLTELSVIVERFADKKTAANVDTFLAMVLSAGVLKAPVPPATSGVSAETKFLAP